MGTAERLAREVRRVARQAGGLPALALDAALARRRAGMAGEAVRRHAGGVAPTGRAAIYLVFPRHGVLGSHALALRHLVARGYSPVVVSNLPLGTAGVETLRPLARAVIERPNIGYDFGGYRDGVLSLAGEPKGGLERLDRLLLINDSSWFPLRTDDDWLERAEGLDVDLVGPTSHWGMPRVPVARWREFAFAHRPAGRNFHYSSFALLFGPRALRDAGFERFWRRYRLTDDKARTVRRGEIGLSQWALRRGLSHAALPPPEDVAASLTTLDPAAMREALERSYLIDDRGMHAERAALLAADDGSAGWRDDAGRFLLAMSARRGAAYVLWHHLAATGWPFLKRTPFANADGDRAELPGGLPIDAEMEAAIRAEIALMRGG